MLLEEKIVLHSKIVDLQLNHLVSRIMLSVEPVGYINGDGIENYFKYQSNLQRCEDEIVKLVDTHGYDIIEEVLTDEFVVGNDLKISIDAQRPLVKQICGHNKSIEELVEWAQKQ